MVVSLRRTGWRGIGKKSHTSLDCIILIPAGRQEPYKYPTSYTLMLSNILALRKPVKFVRTKLATLSIRFVIPVVFIIN